jgi:NADH-quinone oxidoreductase subunit J
MNTVILIIFILISMLILGSALAVVMVKNLIHSALWLIATFFGVGALYLLMQAEFLAVVQIMVYVGAISILILFAIMLTRNVASHQSNLHVEGIELGMLGAMALFGLLILPTVLLYDWDVPTQATEQPIAGALEIGRAFMNEYLLPFEIASILLLVALIGAIVIAYEERGRRRKVLTLAEEFAQRQANAESEAVAAVQPAEPQN